jgi:transcriptional regulator with XRE-family HTH domain
MKKLNAYLKKNKKLHYRFAVEAGVSPNAVYSWMTGKTKPSLANAYKIEKYTKGEVDLYSWVK